MYHNSSHKKFWTFADESQLEELWKRADFQYRSEYCSRDDTKNILDADFFLTRDEHCKITRHYENQLREFCKSFKPQMPFNTIGTACIYMKRLYTKISPMEYHPRICFLVCAWIACKTDEFNVSIEEFMRNITWEIDYDKTVKAMMDLELIVMQKLDFHLTIHNSFRPLEGFLIDLKTRSPNITPDADKLRTNAQEFIFTTFQTNNSLLYSPSQIALAALWFSFSRAKLDPNKYLFDVLLAGMEKEVYNETIKRIRTIRMSSFQIPKVDPEEIKQLKIKLDRCYCKEKDPMSDKFIEINLLNKSAKKKKKHKKNRSNREDGEPDSKKSRQQHQIDTTDVTSSSKPYLLEF